jgi:hypothetical protein
MYFILEIIAYSKYNASVPEKQDQIARGYTLAERIFMRWALTTAWPFAWLLK